MPTSNEDQAFTIIQRQAELIADLHRENAALIEILLTKCNVLPLAEVDQNIEIPEYQKALGREPWYMRQARLERLHRKPKISDITGIPEQEFEEVKEHEIS